MVSSIRKQLKQEKTAKLTKAVMELFESNCKQTAACLSAAETGHGDGSTCSEADSGLGKSPCCAENSDARAAAAADTAADFIGKAVLLAEGVVKSESPPVELQQELANLDDQFKQLQVQGILGGIPDLSDSSSSTSKETKTNHGTNTASSDATASSMPAATTNESSESTKAKLLCKGACHLLREQIIKVHKDLEKKWQKLKESGKLHIVGENETSSEASDDEMEAIDADGATEAAESCDTPSSGTVKPNTPVVSVDCTPRAKLELDLKTEQENIEALLKSPMTPQTPAEVRAKLEFNENGKHY